MILAVSLRPLTANVFPSNDFPISFACDDDLLARPTLNFDPNSVNFVRNRNNLNANIVLDTETSRQLRHNGAGNGIRRIEVLDNCQVINTIELFGGAFQITDLVVPVTLRRNTGVRELWIRAVDNDQRSSTFHPTRFSPIQLGQGRELEYLPLLVNTNNNGAVQLAQRGQGVTCVEDPSVGNNRAFIGGNCGVPGQRNPDDPCLFVAGRIKEPVCPIPVQLQQPFITQRGQRVPSRNNLIPGFFDQQEANNLVTGDRVANFFQNSGFIDRINNEINQPGFPVANQNLFPPVPQSSFPVANNFAVQLPELQFPLWLDRDVVAPFNVRPEPDLNQIVLNALRNQ